MIRAEGGDTLGFCGAASFTPMALSRAVFRTLIASNVFLMSSGEEKVTEMSCLREYVLQRQRREGA